MSHTQQVEQSASAVRRMWERHGIKQPLRFVAFCLSMLPIPVIQQVGQAVDRHLSDKDLDDRLQGLWDKVVALNAAAQTAETVEDAVIEVARAVESSPELQQETRALLQQLGIQQKEFIAIAEDGSFQSILNSLVVAESAVFSSRSGATTSIEGATVQADRTLLHSTGGSKNYVSNSTFQGVGGSVGMQGISTQGNITVQGSSVGFGPNSSLSFGGNPYLVSGKCPNCGTLNQADRRQLTGYTHIQCAGCKAALPFSLQSL
ncbi:hypothetical protein [Lysobacter soyae]|uniref:Uncharacterized protein n=1 Tax=Lysobacter soyae TaxID=2764185 RepID=A0ABX8WNF9_9GAMM|nr:hypothetical protein [Lysobacter sp. CJ11]QYR52963.1 hypothetical protein H8L67_00075 [Lysobacter sp. CJ11]